MLVFAELPILLSARSQRWHSRERVKAEGEMRIRLNRDTVWLAATLLVASVVGVSVGIVGDGSAFRSSNLSVGGVRLGMRATQVINQVGKPVSIEYWGDYEAIGHFFGRAGEVSVHFVSRRPLRTYGTFGVRHEGLDGEVVAIFGTTLEFRGKVIASNHMSLNEFKKNLGGLGPFFEYSRAEGSDDMIAVWYKARVAVYSVGDTVKQIRLGDTSFTSNVVPWTPAPESSL